MSSTVVEQLTHNHTFWGSNPVTVVGEGKWQYFNDEDFNINFFL
jgi:hypothetical protein